MCEVWEYSSSFTYEVRPSQEREKDSLLSCLSEVILMNYTCVLCGGHMCVNCPGGIFHDKEQDFFVHANCQLIQDLVGTEEN